MKFIVEMTRRAERDVAEISDWIAERSPTGAERWLEALEDALNRLTDSPHTFSLADEADAFAEPLRQILFCTPKGRDYRVVFTVDELHVRVLCVRGPGQAPIEETDFEV